MSLLVRTASALLALALGASGLQQQLTNKQALAASASTSSACIEGRLVPELYAIGAMKSGTTAFAKYSVSAGMTNLCPWGVYEKECAFFNAGLNRLQGEDMRQAWLSELPACPDGERQVAADFTPSYLNSVPGPAGVTLKGTLYGSRSECLQEPQPAFCGYFHDHDFPAPAGSTLSDPLSNMSAARDIANMHGELSSDLTLVVILREPLSRMQSQYYHGRHLGFTAVCTECIAPSFRAALNATKQRALQEEPVADDWLWDSMYAAQLEAWLQYFSPSQFMVVPNNYLREDATKTVICNTLRERLSFDLDCEKFVTSTEVFDNTGSHPPLAEDAPAEELAGFRQTVFGEKNAKLFQLLANMTSQGAILTGFEGAGPANAAAVEAWLSDGW